MTNLTTSAFYEFFERVSELNLMRIDVASPVFAVFRRNVRRLIEIVREDHASIANAESIQYSLLQWLSVPMPLAEFDLSPLIALGTPATMAMRWGEDARRCLVEATLAFDELRTSENPLRVAVQDALLDAAASCDSIRIYCNRTARVHFESLEHWRDILELATVDFLGSPRDYRASGFFDSLFKVGPLRNQGVSSIPGAVINAPRFHKLIQVAWLGTADQIGFGDDPVIERLTSRGEETSAREASDHESQSFGAITRHSSVVGDTRMRSEIDFAVVDDFSTERGTRNTRLGPLRKAMLFHLADGLGCLQAPHADIICLHQEGANLSASRIEPSDIDDRITHLVDPALQQVDFGTVQASHGGYAPQWKARLQKEYRGSPVSLADKLRLGGIDLVNLDSRIREWIQTSGNVIHSPKQRRHFEILIEVLGIEGDPISYPRGRRLTWSAAAWAEIAHSRGVAIQHGTESHEIIAEELEILLNNECMTFADQVEPGVSFTWEIPAGRSLTGHVRLHAIHEIEDGYRCPEQILKTIEPIEKLLPWRE
jgi:hypothetical protein